MKKKIYNPGKVGVALEGNKYEKKEKKKKNYNPGEVGVALEEAILQPDTIKHRSMHLLYNFFLYNFFLYNFFF